MVFWTALVMGLVGSLHCVGMCGPLALALPYQTGSRVHALGQVLLYQFGRITTYSLLGAMIGFVGRGLFLAGWQSGFSIFLGILLLAAAIFAIDIEHRLASVSGIRQVHVWARKNLAKWMKQPGSTAMLFIGALNGLLPCGLVYMAVAGAVTANSIPEGAAFMAFFGLGTLPMMTAVAMAGQFISLKWRNRARKLLPLFLIIFALFFIARGLNFQMPAEVRFWETMGEQPMCH
jgi:sulfite exporter TauE/SafE